MDEYTQNPKTAVDRGRAPEVGPRGGVRYRASGPANNSRPMPMGVRPILIGEIHDVGIFEVGGVYKAYIHKDDEKHQKIVEVINKVLKSGGTIFDAMTEAESVYK